MKNNFYKEHSIAIRKDVLTMAFKSQVSHIGSALSCVDILTVLYFKILKINPKNPGAENRDRFILSKGHAAAALYAVLTEKEILDKNLLNTFCQKNSPLGAHPDIGIAGIDVATGSLGHGLSIGAGMALAAKINSQDYRTFVLLSDGECQEGSTWEAAAFASQYKLDNLVALVDYNKLQSLGKIKEIINLEPFKEKWEAFGWSVKEVNGHDTSEIVEALKELPFAESKPSILIANTVKGKGCTFMENSPIFHYRIPSNKEEWERACDELELNREDFKEVLK